MNILFEMVENNNYNDLKQTIVSNPTINLAVKKSGCSLLYNSVKYRAKECFDILVEIPHVITYENTCYVSALSLAIKYYINGKNQSNKYYIDILLENKMTVHNILSHSIKDKELFLYLYDKVDKTTLPILQIINKSLVEGCIYAFECIVDTVINYNLNINNEINYKYEILNEIIAKDNMEALEIFMNNNIQIKNYPFLLYNALKHDSINTFNYFYNIYNKMSIEDLNKIPNVNNIQYIFYDMYYYKNGIKMNMFNMLFKLGIKFENVSLLTADFYTKSLNQFSTYNKNILELLGYNIIILLFENKLIVTNPIEYINIPVFSKVISRTFSNETTKTHFNSIIGRFFDICMTYNFKPTPEIQQLLQKYKIPVK